MILKCYKGVKLIGTFIYKTTLKAREKLFLSAGTKELFVNRIKNLPVRLEFIEETMII
jgi:hypothetical protein